MGAGGYLGGEISDRHAVAYIRLRCVQIDSVKCMGRQEMHLNVIFFVA